MKKTLDELAADVSDPSDFKTIPKLVELDSSLRCNICRELYEGPVSISCGHCFDSLCIRNSMNMSTKPECPSCRKPANESHIRPAIALEEAAVAWRSARPIVLQLMRDNAQSAKRKRNASEESSDDEIQIVTGPSKRQKQGVAELVECPVCQKQVKGNAINGHIDRGCRTPSRSASPSNSPDKSKQRKEWSEVFKGKKAKKKSVVDEEERLPKVSTHILKEKKIREMLNNHGLDITGDKNKLTARYVHWSMLFNSNLDKAPENRQPLERLKKELKTWEELSKGKKVVVDDVKRYEKTQRDEFAKLTSLAKQTVSQQHGPPTSSPVEVIDVE